ncbi:hypothetical protein [Streptomyces sp. YS415]|uniref:hypothetical protein n=1 Tax=Streptomyces sp. YS415 TaxID=2944806 RepID=UPI00202129E0|nr:hypothetical protein [Streptomyces sp. YS415]MCL7424108.1 hypothetical protein [Streptomyces sp. YS415]
MNGDRAPARPAAAPRQRQSACPARPQQQRRAGAGRRRGAAGLLCGCGNPQVVRRLRALLDRVGAETPEDRAQPLHERRAALDRLTATALPDPLLHRTASRPDSQGLGAPTDENPR